MSEDGGYPDVAIARVKRESISRLGRKPIVLAKKNELPKTGIASGYPEEQRVVKQGEKVSMFSPKFSACIASMQTTAKGDILIQDTIEDNQGLDVLSGMSGGPIIWSDRNRFGLAGIVREGFDIQPKQGTLMVENGIWIQGERITVELFEKWLEIVPPLMQLKDESKSLYTPTQS